MSGRASHKSCLCYIHRPLFSLRAANGAGVAAPMSDSSLCRLHAWSKRHACAVVAVADEDSFEDPAATALLRFIFGDVEDLGSRPELVLVVTPHRVQLHCSASALDGARALLVASGSPVPVDVFCPGPQLSLDSDAVLDFKLEATRRMLHGAREEAPSLLAGLSPLAEAATRWPLLRAASLGDAAMERPAAGSTQKAAAALHVLLRSVGQDALHREGGVGSRALRVSSGFSRLVKLMDRVESTHEMRELTEKRLDAALRGADALFEAPPAGSTPPAEDLPCGVWLGARTELSLEQPGGKKLPVRASGPHSRAGRHMIARLSDGGGLAATRTFFLSNGRVCHHWQHRVFPDGDVLEPLVEDEVPEVDGAAGVQRAMRLYCELIAAAADVVAAVAARAPDALAEHEAASILQRRISAAKEAGLLPARYDVAANARVRLGHALCSSPLDPALAAGCGVDAAATAAAEAPLHWQVHSVSLALMGLPRVGEPDTVEGALRFEDSFVLDGRGGAVVLTSAVPRLCAWPGTQAEESEARSVQGALESNSVCPAPFRVVDRLRAGEHHVLQVMCAPPLPNAALLLGSPWLPVVRGEVRLYASGLSFSSPRHGPLVLPFRIHLAAVATHRLNCHDGCGLLLFRQHADPHSYGPLALLPARIGAEQPDIDAPPETALTLALVIRSGSDLQRCIQDNVWSLWTQLFRELGIPCDDLAAPPAEIREALAQYQREEPTASAA